MAIVNLTPEVQRALFATSTTPTYQWLDWMATIGMDDAFATLKLSNMVNNMRVVLATQVAEVRIDRPSAPVPLAGFTPHSADGDYYYSAGDIGVAALVAGQTFIRFGLSQTVSSAPNTGRADANLQVASRQLGRLIAPWSGHLVATTTTSQFVPIAR
jgi:hypothetical protein